MPMCEHSYENKALKIITLKYKIIHSIENSLSSNRKIILFKMESPKENVKKCTRSPLAKSWSALQRYTLIVNWRIFMSLLLGSFPSHVAIFL